MNQRNFEKKSSSLIAATRQTIIARIVVDESSKCFECLFVFSTSLAACMLIYETAKARLFHIHFHISLPPEDLCFDG